MVIGGAEPMWSNELSHMMMSHRALESLLHCATECSSESISAERDTSKHKTLISNSRSVKTVIKNSREVKTVIEYSKN